MATRYSQLLLVHPGDRSRCLVVTVTLLALMIVLRHVPIIALWAGRRCHRPTKAEPPCLRRGSGRLKGNMAPNNKAQAAGVSSGSFLELRSQVEKQKQIYAKEKAAGNASAIVGKQKRKGKVRCNFRHLSCTLA